MNKISESGLVQLQNALSNFAYMEDELQASESEARALRSTVHDLVRDNDSLKAQLEKITVERDRLQAYAVNITTRVHVLQESAENLIRESGRHAVAQAGRMQDERRERPAPRAHALVSEVERTVPAEENDGAAAMAAKWSPINQWP